jgi:hypothetical protein
MISYYTPLLGPLKSMAGQNTSQFLGGSICSFFRGCGCILRLDFRCYSWNDCNSWIFIIMDWWTAGRRHIPKLLSENRGYDEYEKHRIKAPKLLPYLNLFLYTSG